MAKKKTKKQKQAEKNSAMVIGAVIAVIALAAALLFLTPPGKKLSDKLFSPDSTGVSASEDYSEDAESTSNTENTEKTTVQTTAEEETERGYFESDFYSFVADPDRFSVTADGDNAVVTAKTNGDYTMSFTVYGTSSFSDRCKSAALELADMGTAGRLNTTAESKGFRIENGDKKSDKIITAYCVDLGENGCLEIRYTVTVGTKGSYGEQFEKLLETLSIR